MILNDRSRATEGAATKVDIRRSWERDSAAQRSKVLVVLVLVLVDELGKVFSGLESVDRA